MISPIIDTHTHYNDKRYNDDRDTLITDLPSNGVSMIINVGSDMRTSEDSVKLSNKYEHVYATVGVHPHSAKTMSNANLQKLKDLCTNKNNKKIVAFGEIGLDFHHDFSPRDLQRHWFQIQLAIADELDLPVVIHSRESDQEVFDIIADSSVRRGVVHSFSGDWKLALRYVQLGFHLGIGGVITFDKTNRLQSAVSEIPMDRILLETDCPYLTPAPHRGKRNDSTLLTFVVAEIARIKGVTDEIVRSQTTKNAIELFNLKG